MKSCDVHSRIIFVREWRLLFQPPSIYLFPFVSDKVTPLNIEIIKMELYIQGAILFYIQIPAKFPYMDGMGWATQQNAIGGSGGGKSGPAN